MASRKTITTVIGVLILLLLLWIVGEALEERDTGDMPAETIMDEGSSSESNDEMTGQEMDDEMTAANSASSDSAMADEEPAAAYTAYDASVLANGETKVLFFHAAWCPVCRAAEEDITAWYGAGRPSLDMYKVDYDTETELKSRFGVTYQHTFVLVDGEGNAVTTVQGPSDDQLLRMIGV